MSTKEVKFAGIQQVHGLTELGGNYTEEEADLLRTESSKPKMERHESAIDRLVRRTIYREPSGMEVDGLDEVSSLTPRHARLSQATPRISRFPRISDAAKKALRMASVDEKEHTDKVVFFVLAGTALAMGLVGFYSYNAWATARAEAEARAKAAAALSLRQSSGSFKGLLFLLVLVGVVGASLVVPGLLGKASVQDENDHPDKTWRRRTSMKQRGNSPARLRRKNTHYRDESPARRKGSW